MKTGNSQFTDGQKYEERSYQDDPSDDYYASYDA